MRADLRELTRTELSILTFIDSNGAATTKQVEEHLSPLPAMERLTFLHNSGFIEHPTVTQPGANTANVVETQHKLTTAGAEELALYLANRKKPRPEPKIDDGETSEKWRGGSTAPEAPAPVVEPKPAKKAAKPKAPKDGNPLE